MAERVHIDDATLRELLHQLSHDLRNPLAAIVTNLEFVHRLLPELTTDEDAIESIEDSVAACDVLRRIVANMDVLVKGSQTAISLREIRVAEVVREVTARCHARATQAGVEIELADEDASWMAPCDRGMLALALENLLANSLQHAPRSTKTIVAISATDADVRVTVRDEGGAVSKDLRELSVEPRGQTSSGRCEGSRYGRGLGLLCARAAAATTGAALELGGEGKTSELTLVIPRTRS